MVNHFLQSKEWEEFQKSVGREVFRIDGALVIKLPLAFGKNYFYCGGCLPFAIQQISNLAKKEGVIFLKFEPMLALRSPKGAVPFRSSAERRREGGAAKSTGTVPGDFKRSGKEVQPQKTIVLDLTNSEVQLLAQMHSKTRYNIKLAEKRGVKIRSTKHEIQNKNKIQNSNLEALWGLLRKTARRDQFTSHPREYYEKLLELPFAKLFTAEYRGEVIAANIIVFYKGRATYLHGASDYKYRNLMAPYLLHWEVIRYAKEHGYAEYDFWGIDEKKWPGVTRFKKGFGGGEIEYIGSYDYVFQPLWYKLYSFRGLVSEFTKKLKAKS